MEFLSILAESATFGVGLGAAGAAIGAALSALAAGIGLGKVAVGNAEAIARQPEAGGRISGNSLLLGFLIEGVALFACVICLMAQNVAATTAAAEKAPAADTHQTGANH